MTETLASNASVTDAAGPVEEHKPLLASRLVHEDGFGPAIDLGPFQGHASAIHLEIDHVVQHKALCLSVWGSPDGAEWGTVPLISLPPKHYCGNYIVPLDLSRHPEIRYLRVGWRTSSLGHGTTTLFGFSVLLEPASFRRHVPDRSKYAVSAASGTLQN